VNAGEVWWVRFPAGAGHAQHGRRPAVVVQSSAIANVPTVLVVPLTTNIAALRYTGTALIEPGANGLSLPSVALAFQMTVVDKRFITEKAGVLASDEYAAVWAAFDEVTQRLPDAST
jgi:mRNA interferase MazF